MVKLFRIRTRNHTSDRWSSWTNVDRPTSEADNQITYDFPGNRGTITFYTEFICNSDRNLIMDELENCKQFRSYPIQGTTEPRVHFLAHEEATDDDTYNSQATNTLRAYV